AAVYTPSNPLAPEAALGMIASFSSLQTASSFSFTSTSTTAPSKATVSSAAALASSFTSTMQQLSHAISDSLSPDETPVIITHVDDSSSSSSSSSSSDSSPAATTQLRVHRVSTTLLGGSVSQLPVDSSSNSTTFVALPSSILDGQTDVINDSAGVTT